MHFVDNFRTTLGIQNYLRREVRMKDHEQATTIGFEQCENTESVVKIVNISLTVSVFQGSP